MTVVHVKDIAQQAKHFTLYEQIDIGLQYALKANPTDPDLAQARAWFWVAANHYDSFLAHYYWAITWHEFSAQDFPKEIELIQLKQIAAEGQLAAIYMLGLFYETEDTVLAIEYYRYAAERDFYPAINNLADKYEHGLGMRQDLEQAVALYLRAAEHNIAAAEWSLGLLYAYGTGGEQDHQLACYWLQRADQHGWQGADDMIADLQRNSCYC